MPQPARWQLEETIPSVGEAAEQFIDRLGEQLETHGWTDREMFQVRMAVEEAVTNAIEHGNSRDPSKSIRLHCTVDSGSFSLEVVDEGPGFCREDVPDCTEVDRREIQRGRGIMLMESFMSDVEYISRGNRVRLHRRRDDPKFHRPKG